MRRYVWLMAVGLLALTVGAGTRLTGAPAAVPAAAPVAAPLTDVSLRDLLVTMGYEPVDEPITGTVIYHLTFEEGGWTWRIDVSLSTNKRFLWMSTALVTLTDEALVPADALLRILEENRAIGPAAVNYNKKWKQLCIGMPMLNAGGITPSVLRSALSDFMGYTKSAKPLADAALAGRVPTPLPPAPVPPAPLPDR